MPRSSASQAKADARKARSAVVEPLAVRAALWEEDEEGEMLGLDTQPLAPAARPCPRSPLPEWAMYPRRVEAPAGY